MAGTTMVCLRGESPADHKRVMTVNKEITYNGITFAQNKDGSWTDNENERYPTKGVDSEDRAYCVFTEVSNFEDQLYNSYDNMVDAMQGLIELSDRDDFSSRQLDVYDERLTIRDGLEGDTLFVEDITDAMRREP